MLTVTPSRAAILLVCLLAPGSTPARALESGAAPAGALPSPGSLAPSIACAARPEQRYALYLPTAASRGGSRPLLLIMDPRGRALVGMEVFQAAAESHGWIAASSWNTASDGPASVNVDAVNAILPDLSARLTFDPKRLYLAGFSGTARAAWAFAYGAPGRIAGVIGVGAGLPEGLKVSADPPFAFFGITGLRDFNYEEVRALETTLEGLHFPAAFRYFDGSHEWPGPPLGGLALDWLELDAIRRGLRPPDTSLIAQGLAERAEEARALETSGNPVGAWERWRGLLREFEGFAGTDLEPARARAAALGASREVKSWQAERRRQRSDQISFERRLFEMLERYKGTQPAPTLRVALRDLQVESLRRRAGGPDVDDAAAASRLLNLLFVHASFYVPTELEGAGRPARALQLLELAAAVRDPHPSVCYGQARLLCGMGRHEEALQALACYAASPFATIEDLDGEAAFAPLRANPAYSRMAETLRKRTAPVPAP